VSGSCSREALALHVEGDLPPAAAGATARHLKGCEECQAFVAQLRATQALLKSLRRDTVSPSDCAGMRLDLMSNLDVQARFGWALWIERAAMLAFRRHPYAVAACALVAIVSASMVAQLHHASGVATTRSAAVFDGADTLIRPHHYRDWILLSDPSAARATSSDRGRSGPARTPRVYIDPDAYRAYVGTGTFPEGTVMIWEAGRGAPRAMRDPHGQMPVLLASVKDRSRFDVGWGFFVFTGEHGTVKSMVRPEPEPSGCRRCHLAEAETDSVFTQFYSALRPARQGRAQPILVRS
jgi:hypothetical protein